MMVFRCERLRESEDVSSGFHLSITSVYWISAKGDTLRCYRREKKQNFLFEAKKTLFHNKDFWKVKDCALNVIAVLKKTQE
jgi:hypothetical protein